MIGAIIGDIVGSRFEFDNIKTKDFELFDKECDFTDDSVMTLAVAKALTQYKQSKDFKKTLVETMHEVGGQYPNCGYGGQFLDWIVYKETKPYYSCGNGSAMRVSSVGWYAETLIEAEELAKITAEVTHDHPEGIKGAQVVAGAIFLAKVGESKEVIKKYVENYYALDFTLDEIRPTYDYEIVCQTSVPQSIQAFLESTDFEDAIRNAISIGGDSDTVAAITGSIAEAYYEIPEDIKATALSFLDEYLLNIYDECKILRAAERQSFYYTQKQGGIKND